MDRESWFIRGSNSDFLTADYADAIRINQGTRSDCKDADSAFFIRDYPCHPRFKNSDRYFRWLCFLLCKQTGVANTAGDSRGYIYGAMPQRLVNG